MDFSFFFFIFFCCISPSFSSLNKLVIPTTTWIDLLIGNYKAPISLKGINGGGASFISSLFLSNRNNVDKEINIKGYDSELMKKVIENGPIPFTEREFLINGWRWHTQSVIRDLNRFQKLVRSVEATILHQRQTVIGSFLQRQQNSSSDTSKKIPSNNCIDNNSDQIKRMKSGYEFVCGFNWKALIRVENDLFFPWLESLMPSTAKALMKDITDEHKKIGTLSTQVGKICNSLSTNYGNENENENDTKENNHDTSLESIRQIDKLVVEMIDSARHIQLVQEKLFVPYVSAFVSKVEQERFNRGVIARLGLLDSQVT